MFTFVTTILICANAVPLNTVSTRSATLDPIRRLTSDPRLRNCRLHAFAPICSKLWTEGHFQVAVEQAPRFQAAVTATRSARLLQLSGAPQRHHYSWQW